MNKALIRDLFLLTIVVSIIGIYLWALFPKNPNIEPTLTKNPKDRYVIEATFNSVSPLKLQLTGGYANFNQKCDKTIRLLGVLPTHDTPRYYPIRPEIPFKVIGNKAEAVVYGDVFEKGICDWGLADLKIETSDNSPSDGGTDISLVLPKSYYAKTHSDYDYQCGISPILTCVIAQLNYFHNKQILFTVRRIN